jgi:phage shock protein A
MTGRIDELEAEIEASNVIDDPKRAEVEAKFRRLERDTRGSAVDDELAALKAKLDD